MTLELRIIYSTPVCWTQPSVSLDLSSNVETDSTGTQVGMISVSSPPNSCVVFTVRDRVRLVYLSNRDESEVSAFVSRSSYCTLSESMAKRSLTVESWESMG